jgi:hypothetical protein
VKTITSQRAIILAAILSTTLAAGCFGGGGNWHYPLGYNDGSYSSNQYGADYDPYPHNSGYNDAHQYPQTYVSNAYSVDHQNGVRADASRDDQQGKATDQHIAVTADRDQQRIEKQSSSVARND